MAKQNTLSIDLQITGDKALMDALRRVSKNMTDFESELKTVGDFMVDFYSDKVFKTQGAILGSRWVDYKSSAYELRKRELFRGKGMLERTGTMKRGYEYKAEPLTLTVANMTDYAKYHHLGGPIIPQRKLIGFSDDITGKVISVFTKAVLVRLNKAN